ncbi:MAG: hypothetical protein FWE71_09390 [Nocardioidaceae bacterium]|nr:hypothetical protein [Nocardioidaceae bacterium]MCL2612791.1 hypothetical protein [Nocardioidaceae bacterium]
MSATKTFSRRLFLTYQELIEGSGRDLDSAVEKYAAKNRGVDLEQQLTFAQWFEETAPPKGARSK